MGTCTWPPAGPRPSLAPPPAPGRCSSGLHPLANGQRGLASPQATAPPISCSKQGCAGWWVFSEETRKKPPPRTLGELSYPHARTGTAPTQRLRAACGLPGGQQAVRGPDDNDREATEKPCVLGMMHPCPGLWGRGRAHSTGEASCPQSLVLRAALCLPSPPQSIGFKSSFKPWPMLLSG